jgi:hypothetical protein
MTVIELDEVIEVDLARSADWLKGLSAWPWPQIETVEEFRGHLNKLGFTVEGFKATLLFERWKDWMAYLADL